MIAQSLLRSGMSFESETASFVINSRIWSTQPGSRFSRVQSSRHYSVRLLFRKARRHGHTVRRKTAFVDVTASESCHQWVDY